MEEDIKYLEDLIAFAKMLLTTSQRATIQEKEIEVLENLIARYKELEKELLSKSGIYKIDINLKDDYIPKSKVKEKIEEKQNEYEKISQEKFINKNETQKLLCAQIAGYKELLEGS